MDKKQQAKRFFSQPAEYKGDKRYRLSEVCQHSIVSERIVFINFCL